MCFTLAQGDFSPFSFADIGNEADDEQIILHTHSAELDFSNKRSAVLAFNRNFEWCPLQLLLSCSRIVGAMVSMEVATSLWNKQID